MGDGVGEFGSLKNSIRGLFKPFLIKIKRAKYRFCAYLRKVFKRF